MNSPRSCPRRGRPSSCQSRRPGWVRWHRAGDAHTHRRLRKARPPTSRPSPPTLRLSGTGGSNSGGRSQITSSPLSASGIASGSSTPLSTRWPAARNKLYQQVVAQMALRTLRCVFTADRAGVILEAACNGYVDTIDTATGQDAHLCLVSIQVPRAELWACRPRRQSCVSRCGAGAVGACGRRHCRAARRVSREPPGVWFRCSLPGGW
jgi:hypothetical protein